MLNSAAEPVGKTFISSLPLITAVKHNWATDGSRASENDFQVGVARGSHTEAAICKAPCSQRSSHMQLTLSVNTRGKTFNKKVKQAITEARGHQDPRPCRTHNTA